MVKKAECLTKRKRCCKRVLQAILLAVYHIFFRIAYAITTHRFCRLVGTILWAVGTCLPWFADLIAAGRFAVVVIVRIASAGATEVVVLASGNRLIYAVRIGVLNKKALVDGAGIIVITFAVAAAFRDYTLTSMAFSR